MSAKAEFLVSEKDGVGLPIFIEQDVLEPGKLISVREKLQELGLVFERPDRWVNQFYSKWFDLGHPHSLRKAIEKAISAGLNHEEFLGRYGELLEGINRNYHWYPEIIAADSLVIIGYKKPTVSLLVQRDERLERTRRGIIDGIRGFIGSYGIADVDMALREYAIGSQLSLKNPPLIQLGQVRPGSNLSPFDLSNMSLQLSPPHMTHIVFR